MIAGDEERKQRAAEEYADAMRESYRVVVGRTLAARESNVRLARDFFEKTMEEIHEQAKLNRRASRELVGHARKHHEALGELAAESTGVYEEFLGSLPESVRK